MNEEACFEKKLLGVPWLEVRLKSSSQKLKTQVADTRRQKLQKVDESSQLTS